MCVYLIVKLCKLFELKGFDGVSVEEIVVEVGVICGVFYYYFGGKEGFFVVVVEESMKKLY